MKLSARDAVGFFRKPDPKAAGVLLYGGDVMRIAARRKEVIERLAGPDAERDMRLTRIAAADLRKDTALLLDGLKAQGFFPGPRVVLVEEAADGLAPVITAALADWAEGDAQMVVTAGQLAARSALRKLFEGHRAAYAIGIYDDPPGRDEISSWLEQAGLRGLDDAAMGAITALSRVLEPGDLRQTIEKLSLYKRGDDTPVTLPEIEACAPRSSEADLDDLLDMVAEARIGEVGPTLTRLYAQGVLPVGLCIGTLRHFRLLHTLSADPGGPQAAVGKLRPPAFGPRRDRLIRQASRWSVSKLEEALTDLVDADLTLRSASLAPARAVMERVLLRLAAKAASRS